MSKGSWLFHLNETSPYQYEPILKPGDVCIDSEGNEFVIESLDLIDMDWVDVPMEGIGLDQAFFPLMMLQTDQGIRYSCDATRVGWKASDYQDAISLLEAAETPDEIEAVRQCFTHSSYGDSKGQLWAKLPTHCKIKLTT